MIDNPAPKIACCAIVKNEEEVLERMLESVRFMVDRFIIFDTGSTDGTKEIITKYGKVLETPFENFVDTKNVVLEYVNKMDDVDYVLWMDADEYLNINADLLFTLIKENPDIDYFDTDIVDYHKETESIAYTRKRVWKNRNYENGWKFKGPYIHEYMYIPNGKGIINRDIKVYHKHKTKGKNYKESFDFYIKMLKKAVVDDPNDTRGWFYLARTYRDLGDYDSAIKIFDHYIRLAKEINYDWKDEIYQCLVDCGNCYELKSDINGALRKYKQAALYKPGRSECYFFMAKIYFQNKELKDTKKAKAYVMECIKNPIPNNVILFIDKRFYREFPLDLLVSISCEEKDYKLALKTLDVLLKLKLTPSERERFEKNRNYVYRMLKENNEMNLVYMPFATIDNYFSKIFLINLRHRSDRLSKVKQKLKIAGINNYEVFNGYNGEILNPLVDKDVLVRRTGGYLGCLLSHLDIIWQAKRDHLPSILILEDDILIYNNIVPTFNELSKKIEKEHPDWHMLFLGHYSAEGYYDYNKERNIFVPDKKKYSEDTCDVVPATNVWGLHAYAIRDSFYDVILNHYLNMFDIEMDRWYASEIQNKQKYNFKSLICYPQLFLQEGGLSDNTKTISEINYRFLNTEYSKPEDYF